MGYLLHDLELSRPIEQVQLASDRFGIAIVARWHGKPIGFHLESCFPGALLSADKIEAIADRHFAAAMLAARVETAFATPARTTGPSLTIAICTRNRAERLARLLASLTRASPNPTVPSVELLVIDNGATDHTREAVAAFPDARHVLEEKAGLNFARNRALAEARGQLLAFLDDDVVVDTG